MIIDLICLLYSSFSISSVDKPMLCKVHVSDEGPMFNHSNSQNLCIVLRPRWLHLWIIVGPVGTNLMSNEYETNLVVDASILKKCHRYITNVPP